jgi:hypothetical protein
VLGLFRLAVLVAVEVQAKQDRQMEPECLGKAATELVLLLPALLLLAAAVAAVAVVLANL